MFISSNGKIYFKETIDGVDIFREVKKSCEKLIISSTSTTTVEAVDRIFETSEILKKTNSQFVEFEPVEAEEDEAEEKVEKPKRGKPAQKTEKVEAE